MFRISGSFFAVAASAALAAEAQASPAGDLAGALAQQLQSLVGPMTNGGLTITAVRAEEEVLVFEVDGAVGWRGNLGPQALGDHFVAGLCEKGSDLLTKGVKIRFDSTEAGGDKKVGVPVDHCPNETP